MSAAASTAAVSGATAPSRRRKSKPGGKKAHKRDGPDAATLAHLDDDESKLEALVFGGGMTLPTASEAASHRATDGAGASDGRRTAGARWHDEDDFEVLVDIAGTARLRKLRQAETEVAITGSEYSKRLRDKHATLSKGNTAAAVGEDEADGWATLPSVKRSRKAERGAAGGSDDEDEDWPSGRRGRSGSGDSGEYPVGADGDEGDDADEAALLRRAGASVVDTRSGSGDGVAVLPPGHLSITRVRDANRAEPSQAVIQAASFHHSAGSVLFTAGLDHKLRFFAVDGKKNAKVASVLFPDMPIAGAAWSYEGSEVWVAGRRPFFYCYDVAAGAAHKIPRILGREEKSLESVVVQQPPACLQAAAGSGAAATHNVPLTGFLGNDGHVILVSQHTKTWVNNLKMNGSVRAAAFVKPWLSPAGSHTGWSDLLTVGGEGEVYRWDLRMMRCIYRHADEGSTGCTAVAGTEDGRFYAVGSTAGVVNVYDSSAADIACRYSVGMDSAAVTAAVSAAAASGAGASASVLAPHIAAGVPPKPLFTSMHLTTGISQLAFSPGAGEVLAIGSQRERDSFKLVHTRSGKAFSNWPSSSTPLHYVTSTSFSPNAGYIAVGNDKGRVLLYRLNHYAEA